jgi:hypothetical protein
MWSAVDEWHMEEAFITTQIASVFPFLESGNAIEGVLCVEMWILRERCNTW